MKAPRARGVGVTDASTPGLEAVLDLERPTLVRVDAEGPIGKPVGSEGLAMKGLQLPRLLCGTLQNAEDAPLQEPPAPMAHASRQAL